MKKLEIALAGALAAGILASACNPNSSAKRATPGNAPARCEDTAALFDAPKYKLNQLKNVQAKPKSDIQYGVSTFSVDNDDTAAGLTEADVGINLMAKGRITIEKTKGTGKQVFFPYSLGEGLPTVGRNDKKYGDYIAPGSPVLIKAQICIQKNRAEVSTFTSAQCNYRLGITQGADDYWCCTDQSDSMTTADFYPEACLESTRCAAYNRRLEILNNLLPASIVGDLNSKASSKTKAAAKEIGGVQASYLLSLGMLDDMIETAKQNPSASNSSASLTEDIIGTDTCGDSAPTPAPDGNPTPTPTPTPSATATPAPSATPTPTPDASAAPKVPCDKKDDVVPFNMHKDTDGKCVADDGFIEKTTQTRYPTDSASLLIPVGSGVRINPDCASLTADPNAEHVPNPLTNLCECKEGFIAPGIVPDTNKTCTKISEVKDGQVLVARSTEPVIATEAKFNTGITEADCKGNLIVYKPAGDDHGFCLDAQSDCGDTMPFGRMIKEDKEHGIRACVDAPTCSGPTPFIDTRNTNCVSEQQCKDAKMNVDSVNGLCKPTIKDGAEAGWQTAKNVGIAGLAIAGFVTVIWAGDWAYKVYERKRFRDLTKAYNEVLRLEDKLAANKWLQNPPQPEDDIVKAQKEEARKKLNLASGIDHLSDDQREKMEADIDKEAAKYNAKSGDAPKFDIKNGGLGKAISGGTVDVEKSSDGKITFKSESPTMRDPLKNVVLTEDSFTRPPQGDPNGRPRTFKSPPRGDMFNKGGGRAVWWGVFLGALVGLVTVSYTEGTKDVTGGLTEGPQAYGLDALNYIEEMNSLQEQLNSGNFKNTR